MVGPPFEDPLAEVVAVCHTPARHLCGAVLGDVLRQVLESLLPPVLVDIPGPAGQVLEATLTRGIQLPALVGGPLLVNPAPSGKPFRTQAFGTNAVPFSAS